MVGEFEKGKEIPNIIGVGEANSVGMRRGYVVSVKDASMSLRKAILKAEESSGIKIRKAFLGIGGFTVKGENSVGSVIVSKADSEVTSLDIEKALKEATTNLNLANKKVLLASPIAYKLDGKEIFGRIEGNIGNKLEVRALIITVSNQHFEDLIAVVTNAGVEVIDVLPIHLSISEIALSKKQKVVGSMLVDIGSETTKIAIYENEILISLHTFSIGANDITNDIALGLKTNLEEAENIKLGNLNENISKKKLEEIINARLEDIFELIENHLKKIKRNELLPGGIIFSGGGSSTINLLELSKNILKLPSTLAKTEMFGNAKTKLKDNNYFGALGLLFKGQEKVYEEGSFASFFNDLKNTIKSNIKQFLP